MDDISGTRLIDGHDIDFVADILVENNTVKELREMAQKHDVQRERGSNKRETAKQILHMAGHHFVVVEDPRDGWRVMSSKTETGWEK